MKRGRINLVRLRGRSAFALLVVTLVGAAGFAWPFFGGAAASSAGGLPHSTDPADVMYPIYQGPVAQCTALAATDGPVDPARAPGPPAATAAAHPVSRLRAAARRPLKLGRVVVEPRTPHRHALRRRHAGHRRAARGPHRHVRRWGPEPRAVGRAVAPAGGVSHHAPRGSRRHHRGGRA